MKYKGFTYTPAPKTAWDNLSMQEKSEMMKVAVKNGITDLKTIKEKYNVFAEGGNLYAGTSTDNDLVDWIIKEEGFTAKPTDIGDGKMTLGSGLTSQKWHDLYKRRGNKWSETDNRSAVAQEVADRRRWAEKNIPNWDTLPESSQKALLAYKYNYDFNAANSPKLFKALRNSNLHEAARQMNATSRDPRLQKGLMNRRKREQAWFLSDVGMPDIAPSSAPIIAQPVSTSVYNPYPVKVQNTTVAPRMVPDKDSYVKAHQLTEREVRQQKLQERWDAINRFNTLMDMLNIQNNPLKQLTSNNPIFSGIEGLIHADGGNIHIKKENRGKFTALKERTGHSATWFKEHGTPAQKKMAVFDLNSRHWKHGLGGNLFDGTSEDTQQMQVARPDAAYVAKPLIIAPLQKPQHNWEDAAINRAYQVFTNYDEAKDETMPWAITKVRNAARWVKDNIYENVPSGVSNCTLTTTQWVNPANPIAHAASIQNNPEKYGYTKIDSTEAIPGNILITRNPDNDSYHTMLITGFAGQDSTALFDGKQYPVKKGEPLLTYSKGGHDNSFIRRNIPLSAYTPNSDGKTENSFYRYNYPREVFLPEVIVKPKRKKK